MIEFGILKLRSLLNNFAGLTEGGKVKQKKKSNQNLLYSISHTKASRKIISPLPQLFARDPPETDQASSTFKAHFDPARFPSESV
jgi:hypothetical protein